jgi:leucyl aminopeptidase
MNVTVESQDAAQAAVDVLAIPLTMPEASAKSRAPSLPPRLAAKLGGGVGAALASGDFRAKRGETLTVYPDGAAAKRIVLVGLGPERDVDAESLRRAAGSAVGLAAARGATSVGFVLPALRRVRPAAAAQAVAEGAVLGNYRFDGYRTQKKKDDGRTDV